jgi:hypothetical protein
LIREGFYKVTGYVPKVDKRTRLNCTTYLIENGSVFLPGTAAWLAEYLHELTTFPNGKDDDQADSTSQALDWIKVRLSELDFTWPRLHARRRMIEEGRLDEVREMDEKYGAPPEEPKLAVPSGPVVYTGSGEAQKSGGPCVYDRTEGQEPDSRRLKRRSIFPKK